jgi:glutaredoxin
MRTLFALFLIAILPAFAEDPVLYYSSRCPYCEQVIKFLETNQRTIPMKNVAKDPNARVELLEIGGKAEVPCLIIDGEAIYYSGPIIKWLEEHPDSSKPIGLLE